MILTVTPNPSLDRTYEVPSLDRGEVIRATGERMDPGGKGVNVSRALRRLGAEMMSLMPLGGHPGAHVAELARAEGLAPVVVPIQAVTRSAITVQETSTGRTWHYLEPGPGVSPGEIEALQARFQEVLAEAALVILSGSVACAELVPVIPWMVETARAVGRDTIVDTHGAALAAALEARPWMVKPNREELEPKIGFSLATEESRWRALERLAQRSIRVAALSLGTEGLRCLWEGRAYTAAPPAVQAVNALGSGDALVAGVALGRVRGWTPAECLRFGVACGAANAATWDPGGIDPALVAELSPQVELREIAAGENCDA